MNPEPSSVLVRLIDAAERTVCCRPIEHDLAELGELVGAVRAPAGVALSRAPVVLMAVLMALHTERGADDHWRVVAAALLPLLRDDLGRIMEARRRPPPPETDLPYFHR